MQWGLTLRLSRPLPAKHPEFGSALVVGKEEKADQRMIRSMYQRGVGYDYDAVKIFMPAGAKSPTIAPYVEHVPPDPSSRNVLVEEQTNQINGVMPHQLEHVTGKYIISDKPLSVEDWIAARAVVVDGDDAVDVTPEQEQPLLSTVVQGQQQSEEATALQRLP